MDDNYSKRELDMKFTNLEKMMDENHQETLDKLETIEKTVSSMDTTHSESISSLKAWRTGIAMCLALIAFIIIPLVIYSFNLSEENLKQSILLNIKN